jgi:hypothetical protein
LDFSNAWLNWTSELLRSASTCVLLNGEPERRICHVCGLRQGDPYHRCFSSLVMEVLSALFRKSESWELMQPLRASQIKHRASLYADDIFIFLAPVEGELSLPYSIFQMFEGASTPVCNMSKCQIALIRCRTDQIYLATSFFPCPMVPGNPAFSYQATKSLMAIAD